MFVKALVISHTTEHKDIQFGKNKNRKKARKKTSRGKGLKGKNCFVYNLDVLC